MGENELGKDLPPAEGKWVTLGTQGVVHTQGVRGSRKRNARQLPQWSLEIWVQILGLELGSFVAERLDPLSILGPSFAG